MNTPWLEKWTVCFLFNVYFNRISTQVFLFSLKNDMLSTLWWFDPVQQLRTHQLLVHFPPHCEGGEDWKSKCVKDLMCQDEDCLRSEEEKEKEKTKKSKCCKGSHAPPLTSRLLADAQPASEQWLLWKNCPPRLYCWASFYMAWDIPLISWDQLPRYAPSQHLAHPQSPLL